MDYTPTAGVRILETLSKNQKIELWDCSGEERFLPTWKIMDCSGIIMVLNADVNEDVSKYCLDKPIMIFAQKHENPSQTRQRPKLPRSLMRVPVFFTSMENDKAIIRREFDNFVSSI